MRLATSVLFALLMSVTAALAEGQGAVAVKGGSLTRDGRPWMPRGVVQIAFVAPPAAQKGVFAAAYRHFDPDAYAGLRAQGIDSVRMQISQPGLDPQSRLFDKAFRDRVVQAVHAARGAGLTVLLSVQDEEQSGEATPAELPDEATRRVWQAMAPLFGQDRGVMYELLNEPRPGPSPRNWRAWAKAMNETIRTVRDAGARNVIVADGLLFAERLRGAPELADPQHQVVYASHPYAHDPKGETRADWDRKFGNFARTHPVIVTEWTTSRNFYCTTTTPRAAEAFLSYLAERRIGLMAFAWDFSGTSFGSAFQGFPPTPTSYENRQCGDEGFGPGRAILRSYAAWR